jgi:hypothetical protein
MREAQEAPQVVDALPTREEAQALVDEIAAGQPLAPASAARLCIILTAAAFVRQFGRTVVGDPAAGRRCSDLHPCGLGRCVGLCVDEGPSPDETPPPAENR